MTCHRIDELIELLAPEWQKHADLNLIEMLTKIAKDSGFDKPLSELTDDVLIYQLKMCNLSKNDEIPGLKKDYEEDFKSALLRARGILKD